MEILMVRMWMADPRKMCNAHLRGEYVECLMIAGLMRKKRRLDGFLAHNCIEPKAVVKRFAALKREMQKRGFNAKKQLKRADFSYLPRKQQNHRIDVRKNRLLLLSRCKECRRLSRISLS